MSNACAAEVQATHASYHIPDTWCLRAPACDVVPATDRRR